MSLPNTDKNNRRLMKMVADSGGSVVIMRPILKDWGEYVEHDVPDRVVVEQLIRAFVQLDCPEAIDTMVETMRENRINLKEP